MKLGKKVYGTDAEKRRDFLIGFFGWWVVNGLLWILLVQLAGYEAFYLNLFILPLNVIALIILAFLRRWRSLGILAAVALNLAIALILGMGQYGTCAIPIFLGPLYDFHL